MSNSKTRVPQASRADGSESRIDSSVCLEDSGGGKNSILGNTIRKQKPKKIYIATYNIRTMRLEEHLTSLERELENIKWDILGISETRLTGEATTTLRSGHVLFQKNSEATHLGGVAILIHKKIRHLITKMKAVSDRIVYALLRLNQRYSLQVIQAYAPTRTSHRTVL